MGFVEVLRYDWAICEEHGESYDQVGGDEIEGSGVVENFNTSCFVCTTYCGRIETCNNAVKGGRPGLVLLGIGERVLWEG